MKNNFLELPKVAFRLKDYPRPVTKEISENPKANPIARLEKFQADPVPSANLHLIRAYGLGDVYKYVKNSPKFKSDGFKGAIRWKNLRGRPAALKEALKWLSVENIEIQERGFLSRWKHYQIGLSQKVSKNTLEKIKGLCKLSAPSRSTLERVYLTKNNREMFKLSCLRASLSGGATLSRDHGVVDTGDFTDATD